MDELYAIVWWAEIGGHNSLTLIRNKEKAEKHAKDKNWKYTLIGPIIEGQQIYFYPAKV